MAFFLGLVRAVLLSLLVSAVVADKCHKPKVRQEWRKLSSSQRADWIQAVNCLSKLPHDPNMGPTVPTNVSLIPPVNSNSSYYDDFVYIHMDLNMKIHFTGEFLPWHRYYLHFFENALIEKCGYKGVSPYWDWTLDAHDVYNSAFFDNSTKEGLGGWGDANNDYQINTGGFKDMVVTYPSVHHIRRNFSLFPFSNPEVRPPFANDPAAPPAPVGFMVNTTMTKANVDGLVANYTGDYFGFQSYFESSNGAHIGAHLILAGDMTGLCPKNADSSCIVGPKWTPNDPLFFLHHGMVDKIWYDWQKRDARNKWAFGGGSVTASTIFADFIKFPTGTPPYMGYESELYGDGLWNNVTVWDVMDTQGDLLCYTYA